MYEIGILFLYREFEHDVFELTRAFYPEAKFHVFYDAADVKEGDNLFFQISREGDSRFIRWQDEESQGIVCASEIEGSAGGEAPDAPVSPEDDKYGTRRENKDRLKYAIYKLLVQLSGKTLPWGNLTGIRPVKLVMEMLESGMSNPEAAEKCAAVTWSALRKLRWR